MELVIIIFIGGFAALVANRLYGERVAKLAEAATPGVARVAVHGARGAVWAAGVLAIAVATGLCGGLAYYFVVSAGAVPSYALDARAGHSWAKGAYGGIGIVQVKTETLGYASGYQAASEAEVREYKTEKLQSEHSDRAVVIGVLLGCAAGIRSIFRSKRKVTAQETAQRS